MNKDVYVLDTEDVKDYRFDIKCTVVEIAGGNFKVAGVLTI